MIAPTNAFAPLGDTVALAVTGTSQTLSTGASEYAGTGVCIRIANIGTKTVFLEFGLSGSTPTATIPGVSAGSLPMMANTAEVFTVPPGCVLAAIASDTGSTIYVTSGTGV